MQKVLLFNTILLNRRPPLNEASIRQDKEKFIHPQETLPPVYLCKLNKSYVSPYGVVFRNGRIVMESVYSMFVGNRNALTFYKKLLLGRVRRMNGPCLVAHNAYYDNYYHWTLETLPRLFSIRDHLPQLQLLVHENLPAFAKAYLNLFSVRDLIPMKDQELALADELWLPMHTAPGLSHNEILVRSMAAWMLSVIPDNSPDFSGYERVFISREKATYRKAVNEEAVWRVFQEKGFRKVRLEELLLTDQINLMRHVKVLAGIHGAGFTNLMYMQQGQLILDLIHQAHPQPAFYNLACAFGMDYYRFECSGVGKTTYCGNDDLLVDIDKLRAVCQKLFA